MIEFSEIIGHEDIIQHFKRSIEMGKVSQGYIINGEEGSGKKTLTRAIIKTLECEEGGTEPCCKCKSCKQMDTDNQPDVTWVTHDKPNVISVEEIRDQVNKDITIKPYSSRYKIYVIDDAQLLNANAQNALLKTIEEPPEYAIIFLLTSNIDKILPTIISRCIVLNIKPVRERDVLVSFLPQENPLIPELSGLDNLKLWYSGRSAELNSTYSLSILKKLGVDAFLHQKVSTMSGGMKKRLSLAICMLERPDLLLLDEPLAALDLLCKKGILNYLKEYTGNGGSIIVATHEEDALSICNRIYILKDGLLQEANGADYAAMLRA